jgi:hypothetical protein
MPRGAIPTAEHLKNSSTPKPTRTHFQRVVNRPSWRRKSNLGVGSGAPSRHPNKGDCCVMGESRRNVEKSGSCDYLSMIARDA